MAHVSQVELEAALQTLNIMMTICEENLRQCHAVYGDEAALLLQENIYKQLQKLYDHIIGY